MAQEPYPFDEDLEITASQDNGDEYGGLDNAPLVEERRKGNKARLLMIAALAIVLVGGGAIYFAYQFMATSELPPEPMVQAENTAPPTGSTDPAAPPVDPLAQVPNAAPVPGTETPAVIDPNNPVVATTDPNAAPAIPGAPVDAVASTPAEAASGVAVAQTPEEVTLQTTPAPQDPNHPTNIVTPLTPVDPATQEPAIENAQLVATPPPENAEADAAAAAAKTLEATPPLAKTAGNAMPAPPASQLKPLNANDVVAKADTTAAKPQTALQKKTADTLAAVNEILGGDVIPSGATAPQEVTAGMGTPAINNKPPKPVEVTSRAQQVIVVKKSYSASSSQATIAAGDRVLQAKQYDSAAEIYGRELKSNPSDPLALAGKALALQKAGRDVEAMDIYDRLLDLNPRDVEAMTNYLGLLQKQNPDEAMIRLNSLAEQNPDNAAVAGQIAAVFASQMDTPNALRYFLKANALDETNPTYPFNLAVLYDRLGNGAKAHEYYKKALSISSDYPDRGSLPVDVIRQRLKNIGG